MRDLRPPRPEPAELRGEAGFSLVEMVITLLVVGVGLLLAGELLVQSQKMLAQEQAVMVEGVGTSAALAVLRSDLQEASRVVAPAWLDDWTRTDLELIAPDGGRVRYRRDGGDVVREMADGAGRALGERIAFREVTTWRWRPLPGTGLVEVEVGTWPSRPGRIAFADPGASLSERGGEERRRLRVALRGGGSRWGW